MLYYNHKRKRKGDRKMKVIKINLKRYGFDTSNRK